MANSRKTELSRAYWHYAGYLSEPVKEDFEYSYSNPDSLIHYDYEITPLLIEEEVRDDEIFDIADMYGLTEYECTVITAVALLKLRAKMIEGDEFLGHHNHD